MKGIAAGLAAGAVYRAVVGGSRAHGRMMTGSIVAGIVSPLVNTGLFVLALTLLFHDILVTWAAGSELIYYIVFVLTGINFVLELVLNLVLSTVIVRVVGARSLA